MKFGDLVRYDLTASHGGEPESAYVLGVMDYSHLGTYGDDRDCNVVLVGNPGKLGMPINRGHCVVVSGGHDDVCGALREAYEAQFPGHLMPLSQWTEQNAPAA